MKSGLVAAGLRLLGMSGRFVLLLLIGRLLSAEDMGVYGLFAATAMLLVQFVGLELHQPAVREVLRRREHEREPVVRAQLRTYAIVYLFLPAAIALAWAWGLVSAGHTVLLGLVIVGSHLSLESQRLLIAADRAAQGFFVLSLAQGLWVFPLALLWFVAPALRTLDVALTAWACAAALATGYGLRGLRSCGLLTPGSGRAADLAFVRSAWPSARVFVASSLIFLLIESLDRFALDTWTGIAAVGVYTLYSGIARTIREVGFAAIVAKNVPTLVTASQRGDAAAARSALLALQRRLAAFVIMAAPCLLGGLVLLLPLLDAVYAGHLPTFCILIAAAMIGTMSLVPHYELYAAGNEQVILRSHLATLIGAIAALGVLVPPLGIDGAALAALISSALMYFLKWAAARRCRRNLGPSVP